MIYKTVPLGHELNAQQRERLLKAVHDAILDVDKDIGNIKMDAVEDEAGNRFLRILAEVS
jgi:hypothetical protein